MKPAPSRRDFPGARLERDRIARMRIHAWVGLLVLFVAATAEAQDTGGSFGGGDWGSGTDYGSTGGSDYGSSSTDYGSGPTYGTTPTYDSTYDSSGSGGDGGSAIGGAICGLVLVFGFPLLMMLLSSRRTPQAARGWSTVDVTALRLAVDWRSRAFVQKKLDALARSGQTANKAGLVKLLRETASTLSAVRIAWLYADVSNFRPMSQAMAQGTFQQLALDARSRFRRELVRNADGQLATQDAGAQRARPEEGEGVVVVTLVVAARREILDIDEPTHADRVSQLLNQLRGLDASSLVALEVIWSPAVEDDRMSTAELTALYPSLERFERTMGGRVFCSYCAGPYAVELAKCPHCGAPSEHRAQA